MRLSRVLVASALLFSGLVTGAAPEAQAAFTTNIRPVRAIQNGSTDTVDSFAVGVCLPYQGHSGPGDCGGVCSGVLIAPNLVVTARHCVDDSPEDIDCSSATFGAQSADAKQFYVTTSASMSQALTGWHQVQTITTSTSNAVCGNDLALLTLVDTVPSTEASPATPAVQYPVYNHKHYGTSETAIGYGEDAPGATSSALTRREKPGIAIECVMSDPIASEDCVTQDSTWSTNAATGEFVTGNGTCEGDSGSGAFDQVTYAAGHPTVLGVLSRGSESTDGTTCELGIYTRLDLFRDLIVQTVSSASAAGNYSLPSWTTAVADDGDYGDAGSSAGSTGTGSGSSSGGTSVTTQCDAATCASETEAVPSSSGGCDLAGPGRPVPWKSGGLYGLAFGFLWHRRRSRGKKGDPR